MTAVNVGELLVSVVRTTNPRHSVHSGVNPILWLIDGWVLGESLEEVKCGNQDITVCFIP